MALGSSTSVDHDVRARGTCRRVGPTEGDDHVKIGVVALDHQGGVQPYAALALGLRRAGHTVTMIAPTDSVAWLEGLGLHVRALSGGAVEAAREAAKDAAREAKEAKDVKDGAREVPRPRGVVPRRLRERRLQETARHAAELLGAADGCEVLTGGLSGAVVGVDVAEALEVPYVFSHLLPVGSLTRDLPGVLAPGMPRWLGPAGNVAGQLVTEIGLSLPYSAASRSVRRTVLGLPRRRPGNPALLPTLYGFSPHVVPRPQDWPARRHVTGYWFLPPQETAVPQGLAAFLAAGEPPVCVGFASTVVPDPQGLTELVVAAVREAGLRAVLLTGWGGLTRADGDDVFTARTAPHSWLLPQTRAVVHHGGAGTTAAAVVAGVPSVCLPFGADQPFWASRLHGLGVAPAPLSRRRLTVQSLAAALRTAVGDDALGARAERLGAAVRAEDGVGAAVRVLEEWYDTRE